MIVQSTVLLCYCRQKTPRRARDITTRKVVSMRQRKTKILLSVGALSMAVITVSPRMGQAAPTRVRLAGDAPALPAGAVKEGATPSTQTVTVRVQLKLHNQAAAEAAAQAVSTPGSKQYGQFLTPDQFHATYSPTTQDVAQITGWLTGVGLTIGEIPANNSYVTATGTAAQINATFATTTSTVKTADGHRHRAADSDPSVPTQVGSIVDSVSGLTQAAVVPQQAGGSTDAGDGSTPADTTTLTAAGSPTVAPPPDGFRNAQPCSAFWGEKVDTAAPSLGTGFASPLPWAPCGYKPAQLRSAYGLTNAVNHGNDGTGVTVAIVDAFASPTILADATQYAVNNDPTHPLSAAQFSEIDLGPQTFETECGASGWYGEETLDVEAVHAMAPGASILYVGGASCQDTDLNAAVNTIVDGNKASIITNSYGELESDVDPAGVKAFRKVAIQAALQGIGLYFSSGDGGDESGGGNPVQVDASADSPLVTAVGGTSLGVGKKGQVVFEEGWSTGKSTLDPTTNTWSLPIAFVYGAGGGTSAKYSEPVYQFFSVPKSLSLGSDHQRHRVVPDVAMDADPTTGMLVGETQVFPDGTYYDQYRIGGTSLASPLFAGVMALADQKAGFRHGFANPLLYLVSNFGAFRDITPGAQLAAERSDFRNGVDASGGLKTTARTIDSNLQTLHTARGYDNITGLGVPNGQSFLRAMTLGW